MAVSRKGFTLIEMLIVIAIIGILATLVLVGLGPVQRQGRDARRLGDLKQVQNGLELYYAKNGKYPTGVTAWSGTTNTSVQGSMTTAGIGVNQVPDDPSAPNKHYFYAVDAAGTTYVLGAQLEDATNPAMNQSLSATGFTGTAASWETGAPGTCGVASVYCTGI